MQEKRELPWSFLVFGWLAFHCDRSFFVEDSPVFGHSFLCLVFYTANFGHFFSAPEDLVDAFSL